MANDIAFRLASIRRQANMTQKDFAEFLELSLGGLQKIEQSDSIPSGSTLLLYAQKGYNTHWILTGDGNMQMDAGRKAGRLFNPPPLNHDFLLTNKKVVTGKQVEASLEAGHEIDAGLFAAVHSVVTGTFKNEGVSLPQAAVATEVVEAYNAIASKAADSDERHALLPWLETRLRKRLIAARDDPGTSKREA